MGGAQVQAGSVVERLDQFLKFATRQQIEVVGWAGGETGGDAAPELQLSPSSISLQPEDN